MPCTHLKIGGMSAIVCAGRGKRRQCATCKGPAKYLCDWKLENGKTCDAAMCGEHAKCVAVEKHLCPAHQASWRKHPMFRP